MHMTWLGVWHNAHDLARGCGIKHEYNVNADMGPSPNIMRE